LTQPMTHYCVVVAQKNFHDSLLSVRTFAKE
jgi:hypothetical protein